MNRVFVPKQFLQNSEYIIEYPDLGVGKVYTYKEFKLGLKRKSIDSRVVLAQEFTIIKDN